MLKKRIEKIKKGKLEKENDNETPKKERRKYVIYLLYIYKIR